MTTSDLKLLSIAEINESLSKLIGWNLEDNGSSIAKNLDFKDFKEAINFINRVVEIAEQENHHPGIRLHGYNKVELKLTTHSVNGLTKRDFEIAGMVDSL